MSNESLLSCITVDPEICHGKPCIRGLRYPVETIREYLAGGDTIEDLLNEPQWVKSFDASCCLLLERSLTRLAHDEIHFAGLSTTSHA